MTTATNHFQSVNIAEYLSAIGPTLRPPVANRVWFTGPQYFVMVVGGPNQRDDFHLQPGSELFYQLQGGMQLDIMEGDAGRKKIPIGEGEMFLLPKLVHHSPQRFPNTIGIVFERIRSPSDVDFLKWFVPNSTDLLYEESFHCSDIGTQLKIVIERFMSLPLSNVLTTTPRIPLEASTLHVPFSLDQRVQETIASSAGDDQVAGALKSKRIVDGEFVVDAVFGVGEQTFSIASGDHYVMQNVGESVFTINFADSAKESIRLVLQTGHATFFPLSDATVVVSQSSEEAVLLHVSCVMPVVNL